VDRNERARRRSAFGRLREPETRARSLAHALDVEDELDREMAARAPRRKRRITGRLVAFSVIAVFIFSSLGFLGLMVDRYQAEAFLRDHGVATQAVIIDKTYTDRPYRARSRTYELYFRFSPRSSTDGLMGSSIEEHDAVSPTLFAATSVGQTVTIRYNPQRVSQSAIYIGPPPTDRQIIIGDMLLFGVWLVLFGGLCAVIVALAWPARSPPAEEPSDLLNGRRLAPKARSLGRLGR
jgi:hypothetical protein